MILFDIIKLRLRLRRSTVALEGWNAMGTRDMAFRQALVAVQTSSSLKQAEDKLRAMVEEAQLAKREFANRIDWSRRDGR